MRMNTWSKIRRGSAAIVQGARRRSKLTSKKSTYNVHKTLPSPEETHNSSMIEETKVSLYDKLDEKLFKGDLTGRRYADVIRTAHCITIETKDELNQPLFYSACDKITSELIPQKNLREMSRMVLILEKLFRFFATVSTEEDDEDVNEKCDDLVAHIHDFINRYKQQEIEKKHFNLTRLFKELQSYYDSVLIQKVRSVLKFLHLSVVIFAIEELRDKLKLSVEHLTKDVEWKINIKLNPRLIEISHTRRECVLKQRGDNNYWEIQYNVMMSFNPVMTKFFSVRLALKDLNLDDNMDEDLVKELKAKFFNGKFTVC